MRSLDEVLKDLSDAEKEYKEKCEKYGIEEKRKRKVKEEENTVENAEKQEEEKINQNKD